MVGWIEATNLVRIVFGKPDLTVAIDGYIPWARARRWHFPLLEGMARRIKHPNGITHGQRKP